MLRRAVGGATRLVKGMAVFGGAVVTLALVLGVGTAALAAVPGDPLRLGQTNIVNNALTALAGTRAGGAMMLVDNNSNAAGSRALDLRTQPGRAPLTVNSDAGKAPNLDADKVDGKDAAQFLPASDLLLVDVQGNNPSSTDVAAVSRLRAGVFLLTFKRNVSDCHRVVSQGFPRGSAVNSDLFVPDGGEARADNAFRGNSDPSANRRIVVSTRNSAGTLVDESFHLAVFC